MINFNWEDLDSAVKIVASRYKDKKFSGVYGIPRGGLCLAVKISHHLNLPLLFEPQEGCLVVDDIYDSGKTLEKFKNLKNASYFVLISKKDPTWFDSYLTMKNDEWIIFAWEDSSKALIDKEDYYAKN